MNKTYYDSLLSGTFLAPFQYEFWPAIDGPSPKLLIILHGRGDSPEGFHFLPAALGLDRLNILFLQAPDTYGSGYSWYGLAPKQGPGIVRSRNGLTKLLDDLLASEPIRSVDIFLFGFSQGCLMCLDLALRYPKLLGGVVGVSGYVFFEDEYPASFSAVADQQRIWVSHGHQDEMLPFTKTEASIEKLRVQGIHIEWAPFNKAHNIDEVDEIPHIRSFLSRQLESN